MTRMRHAMARRVNTSANLVTFAGALAMAANAQSRNRRLARVTVLERQGYSSEESMRMRCDMPCA